MLCTTVISTRQVTSCVVKQPKDPILSSAKCFVIETMLELVLVLVLLLVLVLVLLLLLLLLLLQFLYLSNPPSLARRRVRVPYWVCRGMYDTRSIWLLLSSAPFGTTTHAITPFE